MINGKVQQTFSLIYTKYIQNKQNKNLIIIFVVDASFIRQFTVRFGWAKGGPLGQKCVYSQDRCYNTKKKRGFCIKVVVIVAKEPLLLTHQTTNKLKKKKHLNALHQLSSHCGSDIFVNHFQFLLERSLECEARKYVEQLKRKHKTMKHIHTYKL